MTASQLLKNSTYLLSALLLAACQPSPSTDEPAPVDNNAAAETPLVITDDSVTMTSDHILSIKPSRYQPSIGLQGNLEPVKQSDFIAAYPVNVVEVLVTEGQLVEKGMPLLIVRRMHTDNSTALASEEASQERELASDVNGTEQADKQVRDASPSSKSTKPVTAGSTAITESGSADDKDVSSPSINADNDNLTDDTVDKDINKEPQYNLVTVRASFKGRIENLRAKTGQKLAARTPLLQLSDETQLYFVATLPIQAEPQLSIGQTVNFTAEGVSDNFTGQVSKLTATSQPKKLLVYVDVIENKTSRDNLMPNMQVTGRVNYGQIDVGTIVPKRALHDVDLTELQTHPYKPLRPLTANVWIIGQDQRLMQRPIEVVEYDPLTKQYLIAGISNDSLICLADLPVDSKGKKVIVS
ncbi:efflux RND transporter periplasmic adaptor subunit [Psychrobacter sp. AOP22-C1-C5]|uniref:efflux RND transporter periplasmic adaptor subunit n=1 Tax=Psychrobacter sp. AOP22-C1-C5 TaxID=3457716 RepID=UPI004035C4A4